MSGKRTVPEPRIVEGEFVPTREVPFSKALDELVAAIRGGKAPNIGRFCGYCTAPLRDSVQRCPTCGSTTREAPPQDRIAQPLAAIYTAKRRREARIVHGAAWFGILIGVTISLGLMVILPGWTKVFAVLLLIAGSYYIASYLGNVLAQGYAYSQGLRLFAARWQQFRAARDAAAGESDAARLSAP